MIRVPLLAVLLTGALLPWAAAPLSAEPDDFDARDHRRLFAVRDTNAARHAIDETRQCLARGQTVRAVHAAQRVLDEMTGDFFLEEEESSVESVLWRSAPEVVREILEGLTPEQRTVYEAMAGPSAAPLLEAALRLRDEGRLREILRRYGASSTGIRTARLLADIAAESGRWRDAARYVQEGLRFVPDDAGMWARLIDALAASGDRHGLEAVTPPEGLRFESRGRPADLRERKAQALAAMPAASRIRGWPTWGGTAARDGLFPDETPMPTRLRWKEETDYRLRYSDRRGLHIRGRSGDDHFEEFLENHRPLQPVVQGRTVYVADGRSVRAYDIYSGRDVWVFDGTSGSPLDLAKPNDRSTPYGRTSLERAFSPVVADDLVVATVEVNRPYDPQRLQNVEISAYLPRRVLVALDRESGALRWSMDQPGMGALTLGSTSIISPPAVAEGLVLAVGSVHKDVHNVSFLAFDLHSGKLAWHRDLGFGQQELNLFGAPVKELAASPVAVADGIAYASTGLGFVAAVNIRSGVPHWLASYEIIPVRKVQYWYAAPLRTPRVAPSPPVVVGNTLLVAPTDGEHIHAFDRRTGKLLWRQPYVTKDMNYDTLGQFLGVANDGKRDVVLMTDRELRARDLKTGEHVWSGRFEPGEDGVVGRGAVAGGEVLVPTKEGLQRFALEGDGAYRGTVPWPERSEPGNLLPLGRVLLVTTRNALQWFYDWAAIERDVQRRREERPDDPTILLEAGEMYLRGGGETERARKAFEEARRVAARSRPEYETRAVQGLFYTWLLAGDQATTFPERATEAYRRALTYAQSPLERVRVRLRIHRMVADDATERVRNLTALVDEAEDAEAVIDPKDGKVPARAAALFLLADEHENAGRYAEAVDALQRVLREERNAQLPSGVAHVSARKAIAALIESAGPMVYARHEKRARELLARAVKADDAELLEQLLDEYPNAQVVPDALLARSRGLLAAGDALQAARYLRRLLADAADHKLAAQALAVLSRAYRAAGATGAARFALSRLARAHRHDRFRLDERTWTGGEFAEAEVRGLGGDVAAETPAVLRAPLREAVFEPVGEDDYARPVLLETDATEPGGPPPPPLALMMRGRELVAIDMRRGRVAWTQDTGHCQRAVLGRGPLVVAVSRDLRGLDPETGKELWRRETQAIVREMHTAQGQVFALIQDLSGLAGHHKLLAVDAQTGEQLWVTDLGREEFRNLVPWRDQVLLTNFRLQRGRSDTALLAFDGFSGTPRHRMRIPLQVEGAGVIDGSTYCVAGRKLSDQGRALVAFDLERGAPAWARDLKGREAVCGLALEGRHVLTLRGDGSLFTHRIEDGELVHETRVFVGDTGRACPFPGTPMIVDKERLTLFPWVRRPALSVVSYERDTGKLAWELPYPQDVHPSKAVLLERGDLLCVMVSHPRDRVQHILLRLVDRRSGKLVQEIEPEGLARANWIPSLVEGHGTLVIFGKSGASIFRHDGR